MPAEAAWPTFATMAAGAFRTIDGRSPSRVSIIAAWPANSPPAGSDNTVVMPSLRAGAQSTEAGFSPSHDRKPAATCRSPAAPASLVSSTMSISTSPRRVDE